MDCVILCVCLSVHPFIHQVIESELQLVSICVLLSEVPENSTSLSLEKTYNKFWICYNIRSPCNVKNKFLYQGKWEQSSRKSKWFQELYSYN